MSGAAQGYEAEGAAILSYRCGTVNLSPLAELLVTLFPGLFGAHRFICGDFAAGMLLAAGAGALASGWDGGALRPLANADVLAAAPAVYGELRALTAQSAGK